MPGWETDRPASSTPLLAAHYFWKCLIAPLLFFFFSSSPQLLSQMCNDGFGSRSLTSHPQSAEPLRLRRRGMRKLLSPPSEMGDGSSVRNTEVRQQGRSRGSCKSKFISIFKAYRWWQRPACTKRPHSHHLKTKHRASMNSFLILMPWTKSIQSEKTFPCICFETLARHYKHH